MTEESTQQSSLLGSKSGLPRVPTWNYSEGSGVAECPVEDPIGYLACSQETAELVGTFLKAIALGLLIILTIFGNVLVLMAVAVSRNLRSSTHYLIVNLAVADLLLGTTVLPFSAAFEITGRWYFGQLFCTVWAAVDVLCCTSSILSLCVISLDRYIGVTRPLAYSTIMVGRRTSILIIIIWAASFAISVGPLFGWKEPPSDDPYFCTVNKQLGYVLFSVTGSFYLPMFIIIAVYWRIYKAAIRQTKFLECGHKTTKQDITLRVHLGGGGLMHQGNFGTPPPRGMKGHHHQRAAANNHLPNEEILRHNQTHTHLQAPLARPEKSSTSSIGNNEDHNGEGGVVLRIHRGGGGGAKGDAANWAAAGRPGPAGSAAASNGIGKLILNGNGRHSAQRGASSRRLMNGCLKSAHHLLTQGGERGEAVSSTPSPPSSSPERKLAPGMGKIAKFRRQKKAAKTLAIVVGVFLVCWFPFFFVLPLGALCESCNIPGWMFDLFFWLGYFNSCLNPIIYGCTSREFQRAFRRILCRRSPPRPHISRAIYRANMCANYRFTDRHNLHHLNHAQLNNMGSPNAHIEANMIPLNHWT